MSRVGRAVYPCDAVGLGPCHRIVRWERMQGAADAPLPANPSGPGRFPLMRRCRLLIGYLPNCVGSALPEGKSAAVAATRNTQTGSLGSKKLVLVAAVYRIAAVDRWAYRC